MILDRLENQALYRDLHPGLAAAFDFLANNQLRSLPHGKHEIDGERLFVTLGARRGKGMGGAKLEAHKRYLDIQLVLSGSDRIGYKPTSQCRPDADGFNDSADIGFFDDEPTSWLELVPGSFAIFHPQDAHAPLSTDDEMLKVVVKIALDW